MKHTQSKDATRNILSQKLNIPTFTADDLERGIQIGKGVFGTMFISKIKFMALTV